MKTFLHILVACNVERQVHNVTGMKALFTNKPLLYCNLNSKRKPEL